MAKKSIHWIEAKQLDRVTNYSTEIEVIKEAIAQNIPFKYYCTFKKNKKYFDLNGNIIYLGSFRNRFIKAIEFQIRVTLLSLSIVLSKKEAVVIVNQDLIKNVLAGVFLNRLLKKKIKFLVDIRTTPTNPDTFDKDMKVFHSKFKYAVKYFDGLSFITPKMESYLMSHYTNKNKVPTVNWSSGVDINIFDPTLYKKEKTKDFTIFYHGGISESRGNLNLIKACEQLVLKGHPLKLQQVGIIVDNSIHEYIRDNNLEDWCKLIPPEDLGNMPKYIANCDLPLLPFPNFMAWRVSSPIKLMEYLAMGKLVMAPDMEAFTDVFGQNSEYVIYYDSKNSDQVNTIANKLEDVIIEKERFAAYNYAPREFVSEHYTWEKQSNNLLSFCQRL